MEVATKEVRHITRLGAYRHFLTIETSSKPFITVHDDGHLELVVGTEVLELYPAQGLFEDDQGHVWTLTVTRDTA